MYCDVVELSATPVCVCVCVCVWCWLSQVHANLVLEYENGLIGGHDSLPTVGYYHFGRHVVALQPPEADRLGLYCVFDGFNHDRCDGYIAHEASMDICAEITFVRQHGPYSLSMVAGSLSMLNRVIIFTKFWWVHEKQTSDSQRSKVKVQQLNVILIGVAFHNTPYDAISTNHLCAFSRLRAGVGLSHFLVATTL